MWQQLLQDRDKSVKDVRRFSAVRTEADLPSSADKLLPLTLTIPPRCGVPPVTGTQPEQKFHRPFEVASRADTASQRNKLAKPLHSNRTPDRPQPPPPPLVHRSTSERNGTGVEVRRRQPQAAARLDEKFGTLSVTSAADDTPLNLVVGRHGSSSQHWSTAVNCTNTCELSQSTPAPSVVSDSWPRQWNKSDTSSLVSLLDRKSTLKAARQKSSAPDQSSSDDEQLNDDDSMVEAKRRAHLLLIMSGPPLKPDNSPSKMQFLQQFGLVSSSDREGEQKLLLLLLSLCLTDRFFWRSLCLAGCPPKEELLGITVATFYRLGGLRITLLTVSKH